ERPYRSNVAARTFPYPGDHDNRGCATLLRSSARPAPGCSPQGTSDGGETHGRCPPFGVRLRESGVESIKPLHAHLWSGTARRLPATRAPVSPGRRSRLIVEPIQWWMYPALSRMITGLPSCSSATHRRDLTPTAAV